MSEIETRKFFEELGKIDDSPDWDEVISVAKNKNSYQLALIDELMEKAESFSEGTRDIRVREILTVGPLFDDDPSATTQNVVNHIRTSFLRTLERMGFIQDFNTSIEHDDESRIDLLTVQFCFVPAEFKKRINAWKIESRKKSEEPAKDKKKKIPSTDIKGADGYLLIGDEKIFIGGAKTGKFRLIELLCTHFSKSRTTDSIFEYIQTDRNKQDATYVDPYLGPMKKMSIINMQFKEVQRAIRIYARDNGIKKSLLPRLSLKWDKNRSAWIEAVGGI